MADGELVERYAQGQVSRRVFIRRLVAGGLSLGAAMAYSDVLRAAPAEAAHCGYFYEPSTTARVVYVRGGFSPATLTNVALGAQVQWRFGIQYTAHQVRDHTGMNLYDSGPRTYCDHFEHTFVGAGLYRYACVDHPSHHQPIGTPVGQVRVPPTVTPSSGPPGTRFVVRWASQPLSGFRFDAHLRRPGSTQWERLWHNRTGKQAAIVLTAPGEYFVRARTRLEGTTLASGFLSRKFVVT